MVYSIDSSPTSVCVLCHRQLIATNCSEKLIFCGHLHEAKIHSELSRHYWWPGMRVDLTKWCRSCVRCATRGVGRPVRPPLTPIPVAGPFDRVGVDVLQLPSGKRYAVVFMDYLTLQDSCRHCLFPVYRELGIPLLCS